METENVQENRSSIEVSRTSKGAYSWKIKNYYNEALVNHQDVIHLIENADRLLKEKFKEEVTPI